MHQHKLSHQISTNETNEVNTKGLLTIGLSVTLQIMNIGSTL